MKSLKETETMLGRKLKKAEKDIFKYFNDNKFELYVTERKTLGSRLAQVK